MVEFRVEQGKLHVDVLVWWSHSVFAHTIGGLLVTGFAVLIAAGTVLAVLTGLLHLVGGFKEAFAGGFRRGWDRSGGDAPGE